MNSTTVSERPTRRRAPRRTIVWALVSAGVMGILIACGLAGFRADLLLGDSMTPALEPGSILVQQTTAVDRLDIDDIVTVEENGHRITHRIQSIEPAADASTSVVLQGDAAADPEPPRMIDSADRLLFALPASGMLLAVAGAGLLALGIVVFRRERARTPRRSRRGKRLVASLGPALCVMLFATQLTGVSQGAFTDRAEAEGKVSSTEVGGPAIIPGECSIETSGNRAFAFVTWKVADSSITPTEYLVSILSTFGSRQVTITGAGYSVGGTNSDWSVSTGRTATWEVYVRARVRDPQTNEITWDSGPGETNGYGVRVAQLNVVGGLSGRPPLVTCM